MVAVLPAEPGEGPWPGLAPRPPPLLLPTPPLPIRPPICPPPIHPPIRPTKGRSRFGNPKHCAGPVGQLKFSGMVGLLNPIREGWGWLGNLKDAPALKFSPELELLNPSMVGLSSNLQQLVDSVN